MIVPFTCCIHVVMLPGEKKYPAQPKSVGSTFWRTHSFRQNTCPQVSANRVTPRSSTESAGLSITLAISSEASNARKGVKHIGHDESGATTISASRTSESISKKEYRAFHGPFWSNAVKSSSLSEGSFSISSFLWLFMSWELMG